ncbi:MFS transporter [Bordetella petrii]|nr:MFS transporter [Bordetella petrii]
MQKPEPLILLALAGVQFTFVLGFMMMLPLGPQFINDLHITTRQFSTLLAAYTFIAAASNLLATTYIDRYGRRTLMLVVYGLFLVATITCGLAPDYHSLLLARAFAGATGGLLGSMVQLFVADLIPYERRGRALGVVMSAMSVSAVVGIPLALFLANHFPALSWRASFFFLACMIAAMFCACCWILPPIPGRTKHTDPGKVLKTIFAVAKDRNHISAFVLILMLMMASFTVTPYVPLYLTLNLGQPESFITLVYLCGGIANFFGAQVFGRMADKYGKPRVFRTVAFISFVPVLITTHLPVVPWWLILINAVLFFIFVSGRMGPGMALISAVPKPEVRGPFMSLVFTLQMLSFSLASLSSGLIIHRDPNGNLQNFNWVGYLAVACGAATIFLAHRVETHLKAATGAR